MPNSLGLLSACGSAETFETRIANVQRPVKCRNEITLRRGDEDLCCRCVTGMPKYRSLDLLDRCTTLRPFLRTAHC